ncbi:hypothetical protein N0V94_000012 [Neodidymelliopsis sp. IMI 364377]|nr:hypothetical protein N0V94_000012 [Neodidymelliopsis sp. IMI 364377]
MSDASDLSAKEMQVLALAWQCMETDPKIDFAKLAALTGYTPGSANVTFGKIKRKLKAKAAATSGVPVAPKTPKKSTTATTPKSGKRGAAGIDGATADTPSKRSKKVSKPARDEDDDEEFATLKVKKEEIDDIAAGADVFFQEMNAYAEVGRDEI